MAAMIDFRSTIAALSSGRLQDAMMVAALWTI
jgi:hypothetical protein